MTTLKEGAQAYEPKRTLNIADLDRVDISLPLENREGVGEDGKSYQYKVMVANGIDYRVPFTVLDEMKKMLALKPDLTHIKVIRIGSGLNTRYTVNIA